MDRISDEAEPMPPRGHPIREVRLTPWVLIRECHRQRTNSIGMKSTVAHADKGDLWFGPNDFVRRPTLWSIKNTNLPGL